MIARVLTVFIKSGSEDDAIRRYTAEVVPVLEAQPGFRDAYLYVDRQDGRGLVIHTWESEAALHAYERDHFPAIIRSFADVLTDNQARDVFEVALSHHNQRSA